MRFILPFLILILCFISFPSSNILSQKEHKQEVEELSSEDLQKIQKFMSDYDKKIEKALSEDKKNYQSMKDDIGKISKLKNNSEKISAINAYQKKYINAYNSALKKANIDLNEVVKTFNNMYPKFEITMKNNAIYFKSISKYNPPANLNTDKTEIVKLEDFEESRDLSCMVGAGGDVRHTSNSVEATSIALVAGGCINVGSKILTYIPPKDFKSAVLKIKGNVLIECFAVSVLGSSFSYNAASLSHIGSLSSMAFAPLLWVAYDFSEISLNSETEIKKGFGYTILARCFSSSLAAICCETHGRSQVSNIEAKVYLKR